MPLGTRTLLWFGHGWKDERKYGLGMDALVTVCLLEHERYYGLAMDALVIARMER